MTGIIAINKPKGLTSFGVIARVRRIAGEKKVGHTGTLDPMATGVLCVMLGGATRFNELLPVHDKSYRATIKLGMTTDTLDITGKVTSECVPTTTTDEFVNIMNSFAGTIEQMPPMYSAVSKDGVRLYELARKGIELEREKRTAVIHSLKLISADDVKHEYVIDVSCSAGTYIRTLSDDIGRKLGCGAVLTELCRTSANGFTVDKSITLEQLEDAAKSGELSEFLVPVEAALDYPRIAVTQPQAVRFRNGGELMLSRLKAPRSLGYFCVTDSEGNFLGLGEIAPDSDSLTVKRVYVEA